MIATAISASLCALALASRACISPFWAIVASVIVPNSSAKRFGEHSPSSSDHVTRERRELLIALAFQKKILDERPFRFKI